MRLGRIPSTVRLDSIGSRALLREVDQVYPECPYIDRQALKRDALVVLAYARGDTPLAGARAAIDRWRTLPMRGVRIALISRCADGRQSIEEGRGVTVRELAELASLAPRYVRRERLLRDVPLVSEKRPKRYEPRAALAWLSARLTAGGPRR